MAAEKRAEASRQLTLKQLRAGKSTAAGRAAVAVLRAQAAEAAKRAGGGADGSQGQAGSSKSAAGDSEVYAALAREFGKERLTRVLLMFREQVLRDGGGASVTPDHDVLVSALVADRASELDVAVAGAHGERVEDVGRTRWGKMQRELPREIVEWLLSAFELQYGAGAREILGASWSRDLELWDDLVDSLRTVGVSSPHGASCESEEVLECLRDCLRKHVRLATICTEHVVAPSDEQALARLRLQGMEVGRGQVWTRFLDDRDMLLRYSANQCLADSLCQLLQRAGVLSNEISDRERVEACAENRRRLASHRDASVRPRDRCAATGADRGEDPLAYLQHDVHAEPTVWFLLDWFRAKGKLLQELPRGGIRLTVFSRFDSVIGGRPVENICARDVAEVEGQLRLNLYCVSGSGPSGYHYDPLFGDAVEE